MNESDKYETMSDDKMTALFQRAIAVEDENHEPYLLYPDGHRKYYDDNKDQFFIVYPNGKKEYIND